MPATATRQDVEDFLYREARLLDERRFEEWLTLFTPDGVFWIPFEDGMDPLSQPSILYDDNNMRAKRVHQLLHEPHYCQMPASRTIHFISNVELGEENTAGQLPVWCNVAVQELRPGEHGSIHYGLDRQQTIIGRCHYLLQRQEGRWAIALKKMLLINRDSALENLSFIV